MKIGVFGLGFMGSTHLKAIKNIPEAELSAVASDVPQALTGDLSGVQGNLGGPGEKWDFTRLARYDNVLDAVRDPDVEIVDLCLPTHLHGEAAIQALRAGKHVLVEKPMALNSAVCCQMIEEARKNERLLMVAQVVRFLPAYNAVYEAVKSGRLGTVRSAIFRRRCSAPAWSIWMHKKQLSGGGIFDLLVHDIDFCLHMFGAPQAISSVGHEDMERGIDWITTELFYENQGPVVISGGWHHPKAFPFSAEYTVVGDNGTVEFPAGAAAPTLYRVDGESEAMPLTGPDGYQAEIAYFVKCCQEKRWPEFCPPEQSAAAVRLAELMVEARNRNGEKIACNL